MLVADLNRSVINKGTLGWMGRGDYQSIEDVEEGEISDSASVEEISEEDFKKQEARVSNLNSKPRVWMMRDLYKYSNSRNYVSGLYNLAWAQAVQNKPLGEVLMEFKPTDDSRSASSTSLNSTDNTNNNISSNSSAKEVNNKVIIDVSGDETDDAKMEDLQDGKEEGELEEGEIDLDSEVVQMVEDGILNNGDLDRSNAAEADLEGKEIEKRITSVREELEALTVNVEEQLFHEVCSRLQNLLDCLWEIFLENSCLVKDGLIELAFAAIRALNSVFCSMNQNQKEHYKGYLLRLLAHITSQNPRFPPFFSPEQMKEIEIMTASLGSPTFSLSTEDNDREKERQVFQKMNQDYSVASADLASSKKFVLDSMSVESPYQYAPSVVSEPLRSGMGRLRGRGMLLPLLDLHKDHDADSLPSPTRETTQCLPVNNTMPVSNAVTAGGMLKQVLPQPRAALDTENTLVHPYETEALKAVSTYQQKFGQSSFFLRDRLPSPTPSEECDDGGGDTGGEISSSSVVCNTNAASATVLAQPTASTISCASHEKISSGQGLITAGHSGGIFSSESKLRASAKRRDPRLRLANSSVGALDLIQRSMTGANAEPKVDSHRGMINSRKQKTVEDPVSDGPVHKRQRNGFNDCDSVRDVHTSGGSSGCLEDRGTVGSQLLNRNQIVENAGIVSRKLENVTCSSSGSCIPDVAIGGNEQLPSTSTSTTASLHTILKDIVVNPTVWMNIIKLEQKKSVDPAKIATQASSSNSILGAVPVTNAAPLGAVSLTNAPPSKSSVIGQRSAGILQTPPFASTSLQDELGKIRMKPRDPRRVLHNNTFQKSVSLVSDHFRTNEPCQANSNSNSQGVKDHLNAQKQEDQSDKKPVSSQSSSPPDIAPQFTKNLKDIAEIISVSQEPITPEVPQNFPSQPVQVHSSRVEVKGELQNGTGFSSKEVVADPSRTQNNWGDVEHLFEGFDDHQKAAIQKERARRLEEQKKMFAARKLCLVLDLDHTLLNSAKFVEVDPAHDEILRKKEEQDREKPYRHLFRFPHMGMWTKLRPGIWNFLEKASKLFELHLYTMGNKLYATEMAKVLDPKGDLFAGRVISRGDDGDLFDGDERVPKSKDLDGVLGMESSVVIMDDSIRVWPHNKLNLIVVERYIYFPCSRRQFGLPGPSLLEIDHDERPEDGTLASSLAVIERIHENFFSHHSLDEADVRNILASEQQKILGGCRIVFSRVFPVGEANPHLHPLWQMAEQFGAVCTNQIDEHVTHVVANSLGTDKVNWALSTERFVVHPGWVEASALLYRRANEHEFAIKP